MSLSVNQQHRRTYAGINLRRLERNFRLLRDLLPTGSFVCPMVKANAYGHGDVEVARTLAAAGVGWLGVCLLEEGIRLRDAGVQTPILVFGIFEDFSAGLVLEYGLTPVISDWHELESLDLVARKALAIHLKFNTGMSRLGFSVEDAPALRNWLDLHPKFRLEGIATHLLHGEDAGIPGGESEAQLVRLQQALRPFQGLNFYTHVLNSSAAVTMQARVRADAQLAKGSSWPLGMRPGIALYGSRPSSHETYALDLQPVMSLHSQICLTRRLRAGEKVSYNAIWKAERDTLLGVVPIGYADGFVRGHSNNADVLCRGRRAPVVGTVCMDYIMVDLTDVARVSNENGSEKSGEIQPGEEIVLLGEQAGEKIEAEELARRTNTITYEVFTRISARVPRVFHK